MFLNDYLLACEKSMVRTLALRLDINKHLPYNYIGTCLHYRPFSKAIDHKAKIRPDFQCQIKVFFPIKKD